VCGVVALWYVYIGAAIDALLHHANARLALTRALRAAGHHDEAGAEEARAIELWEAKGATLLAERARRVTPRPGDQAPRVVPARPMRRRVRENAATTNHTSLAAAVAVRDDDALLRLLADDMEVVHHPTGATYDRQGSLAHWRSAFQAQDLTFTIEALATLGDSLALCRSSRSGSRAAGRKFDISAYEQVDIVVIEVDAQGR